MNADGVGRATMIIALEELRRFLREEPSRISQAARQPRRVRGESGAEYIHRLLSDPDSCQEQLRLDRNMFDALVGLMVERNLLVEGRYIKAAEQVAICLYILAKGVSYRDAKDTFDHSISTISDYFHDVLKALVILSFDIIRPHRELSDVPPEVQDNPKYWPYFKDAIGALDGTLIDAVVSDENGVAFRDRHGVKSWNVLACCSFDRIFTFVNVGWEGSVHDITVWRDSLTNAKFCFPHPPEGKYYLADSGYPNTLGYLTPIKAPGVRVHTPEFAKAPPRGMYEHFNKLHSSLRMKVECSFGQLKTRWKVLKNMPQMDLPYQMSIIVSCFTLHNFIRMQTLGIPIRQHNEDVRGAVDVGMFDDARKKHMDEVREEIAKQIYLANRSESDTDDIEQEDEEIVP